MVHNRLYDWECQGCQNVFTASEDEVKNFKCEHCGYTKLKKKFGSFEWDFGPNLKRLELRQEG